MYMHLSALALGSACQSQKLLDVYPLEVCFSLEPNNKRIECPVTLTNRTDHHVGVWITPTCCPDALSGGLGFPYLWEPPQESCNDELGSTLFCGLGPHSSIVIYMTTTKQQQQQQPPLHHADMGMFDVVMFTARSEEALGDLECYLTYGSTKMNKLEEPLLMEVKGLGTQVYRATLTATTVTYDPAARLLCHEVVTHEVSSP